LSWYSYSFNHGCGKEYLPAWEWSGSNTKA